MHSIPPIQYRRSIQGISAVLLPWTPDWKIDFDSYQRGLERTWRCGLTPAVNMDTGYANLLSPTQRQEVLTVVEQAAAGRRFVAGAFVEDLDGDVVRNYSDQCVLIQDAGGVPILFQSTKLTQLPREKLVAAYRTVARNCDQVIGFELGKMFVPFGEIYDLDTFRELLSIPTLIGIKHSSLSREQEWQRLAIRDEERPDFKVYTGNDLAIDMVQWGSDYLLGLSAFYPEAFARRDSYWAAGDIRFYELNDWLQYLGFVAFRDPVPAYKHNCSMVLAKRGVIAHDTIPPKAMSRPNSDYDLLTPILQRIDAMLS
ncbi:MAG: dihydrodipicolinate synthase family protein [Pirellula sp.]|nr:dihydrodipicolinate synthase family protein [Pirellula sp.]